MKPRKSNKLIDKLRIAWTNADEETREEIRELGQRLIAVHQECIAFLIANQRDAKVVNPPMTPF